MGFNWGNIPQSQYPFLPRVYYKNIILSAAHWSLLEDEIAYMHKLPNDRIINEIKSWRGKRQIPEKVLLGEAFGLKRTWSVKTDRLVYDWELLSAKREAKGGLPPAEQKAFEQLTDQMKFVFDENPEETPHA